MLNVKYSNGSNEEIVFSKRYGYVIERPQGIDSVAAAYGETAAFNNVGTILGRATIQHRTITISGVIAGERQMAARRQLLHVMIPGSTGRLSVGDYYVEAVVLSSPVIEGVPMGAKFSVQLMAPYPYWTCQIKSSVQFQAANQSQIIHNDGDVAVPFVFGFTPGANAQKVRLQTTDGQQITAIYPQSFFIGGTRYELRVERMTAKLYDYHNGSWRFLLGFGTAVDPSSTLFQLPRGESDIYVTVPGNEMGISAYVEWAEEEVGIE